MDKISGGQDGKLIYAKSRLFPIAFQLEHRLRLKHGNSATFSALQETLDRGLQRFSEKRDN